MLGSYNEHYGKARIEAFQNLIGMLGSGLGLGLGLGLDWFQNLIGMLGSGRNTTGVDTLMRVSKPYRYARKAFFLNRTELVIYVSKPYRYARKKKQCHTDIQ